MTIRSRLLSFLLPTIIAFVALISYFFYYNWSKELINQFRSQLQSIVVSIAASIDPEEIETLSPQTDRESEVYQNYYNYLKELQKKLPLANIYIVKVEPVQIGEPVIPNRPVSPENPIYKGINPRYAFRQIYLVDPAKNTADEGIYDFSETDEHLIYLNKQPIVSQIYEGQLLHERFITGYAPITNEQGNVVALLGADYSLNVIDKKLQNALMIMLLGAAITILLTTLSTFLIADRLTEPVEQLNHAALAIAAGKYGENIEVKGPKEVEELANTLNTMSECLKDTLAKFQEASLLKERMYGEYECSKLLQYYMLQNPIENFKHSHLSCKQLHIPSSIKSTGVLFQFQPVDKQNFHFIFSEAKRSGLAGMYNLISDPEKNGFWIKGVFTDNYTNITTENDGMPEPLLWSTSGEQFLKNSPLKNQDYIFVFNKGFAEQFENRSAIKQWFQKVLQHFAADGLEPFMGVLNHELNFLYQKNYTEQDLLIVGFQVYI